MKIFSKNHAALLEEREEIIIVDKMTHKEQSHLGKLLLFIIILIISLTCLHFNKTQSYNNYERVQFKSAGAVLYANLYYPSKTITFQNKSPLIIYCHGIGSKRDFDLRFPIELTKRGFYLVALDYQGHGESGGNINNIDPITGIPALAQDCSKLLDKLETMPFYSEIDTNQIGLLGHSLGGMVVLMNQALDSRFNVTVGLAPLINFEPPRFGFVYNRNFLNYIPANLLNEKNTHNLLVIHHVNDEILDYTENALKVQKLTNCTLIPVKGFLIGGAHQLYSDKVLIKTINWFEQHFFDSKTLNGPIYITFYWNYILIIFNISLLILTVICLITVSCSIFFKEERKFEMSASQDYSLLIPSFDKKKQILKIPVSIGLFVLNWVIFERIFGLIGIIYASLNMIFIYTLIKLILYIKKHENEINKVSISNVIKDQLKLKYIIFTLISAVYFIAIYMIFSFYYPFSFIWPSNFVVHFALGYLIFPVFLSIEIFFRKILYPQLSFLKSKGSKTKVFITIMVLVLIVLMFLTKKLSYFPSLLFTYLILAIVIILNEKLFENMKIFYPVVIISFSIVQIFFAAVISNAIGISLSLK
ncbi:MAG: alpha/beta hydrolase family protein [Promethearchaeota archaeon]